MAKLHISPEAQNDLKGIKDYIATQLENPTAAADTIIKITKAIRSLTDFPDMGAPLSSKIEIQTHYRFLVSGKYLIFYRYDKSAVNIIRVLHHRRDYLNVLFYD